MATSSAAVIGLATAGVVAPAAIAADDAAAAERIIVTGSRIQRRDFEANSPIVTVDADSFESQTGINLESYLNRLPQFTPALTPETGDFDVQPTAINSVGISTLSLRGLGANRNLILVDGRRQTPINALMTVDVNSIPSAMIQRVEIITGGASAVYGADAVGGVVNFILRDDFEGLEVDAQYGITEVGDGEQARISALLGANFTDGRGNVTIGLEHYNRSPAWNYNRDFYLDAWADPFVSTNEFFTVTHGYSPTFGRGTPFHQTVDALFTDRQVGTRICPVLGPPGTLPSCLFPDFNFNTDGTIWTGNPGFGGSAFGAAGIYKFNGELDGREHALFATYDASTGGNLLSNVIKSNNEFNFTSSPQTRYSIFGTGRYDITDNIEFYMRGNFAHSNTRTNLFPSPAITGWATEIPYTPQWDSPVDPSLNYGDPAVAAAVLADPTNPLYANPDFRATGTTGPMGAHFPVPVELAVLLNSRGAQSYCLAQPQPPGTPGACPPGPLPPNLLGTNNPALVNTATGVYNEAVRDGPWQLKFIPDDWFADRSTIDYNEVWQLDAGLRGDLPFRDWTWDFLISHGQSSTYNINNGNFSLQRYQGMLSGDGLLNAFGTPLVGPDSNWDYGRGQTYRGNQGPPNNAFGAATVTCESGFYDTIFSQAAPSPDCEFAINATLQGRTQHQQYISELNLQGGVVDLPAGELRAAVGVQYRQNDVQYFPDILQSTASFLDQVIGVYPTAYLDASTHSEEVYGELLVPILADLPLVQEFGLELGARYSNYSKTDDEWTYKALFDWSVNDFLRLRGGYNRASRAANVGELFLNQQTLFGAGSAFGDPCSYRAIAPFGAGGAGADPVMTPFELPTAVVNINGAAGAESAELICRALMGPMGAATYYGGNAPNTGPAVFAFQQQLGNPNLSSEVGDTWTIGAVVSSPFDNPWLSGFSASIDYYLLEITDAIQTQSQDYVRNLCFGTVLVTNATEAAAQAATAECQAVKRNQANGAEQEVLVRFDNLAHIETSGVDLAVNWTADFEDLGVPFIPGGVGVNVLFNYLDYYRTQQTPDYFSPEIEWKGSFGPNLPGTNMGAYEYKVFSTFNYFVGPASFSLRHRHLPEVEDLSVPLVEASAAAGLPFTPSTLVASKKYDIFDLSANLQVNDTVALRAGVDNLFDTPPIRTGQNLGNVAPGQNYCAALGSPANCIEPGIALPANQGGFGDGTNSGFYDVLGRRVFVGVKLTY